MTLLQRCLFLRGRVLRLPSRRLRSQGGFSLIEALVAMAIAAIALASLYRSVAQGSKNVVDVQARVEATLVAKSAVAAGMYAEDLMRLSSGEAGEWRWRIEVVPEQIPVLQGDLQPRPMAPIRAARVTVEVSKEGAPAVTWVTWKPYRTPA